LNQQAIVQSADRRIMVNRAFLNLMGARYVVFDLGNPGVNEPQMILDDLGRNYTAVLTNEDFIVFRNDTARPYITAYARACLYAGDIRKSSSLALALSAKNWPLVQAKEPSVSEVPNATAQKYEKIYGEDSSLFPPLNEGAPVALSDVQLTRENSQLVRIHLTAPSSCVAVIAESYYPFWRAEVDGQPGDVQQVSCGLMGVELPAGSHTIVLRYQTPRVYAMAGVISVATLLVGIGFSVLSGKRSAR
jgi:uncharacterized membrane protein YfhO